MNKDKSSMITQQILVLQGIMKDIVVLGDYVRQGTVSPRITWEELDEIWEMLYDVASKLRKEAP
tara:strand:+ start:1196 stop:1387 length:192 start_codon:yes stop_codon:yes gene_type:complete